jgi:hypothetical protein
MLKIISTLFGGSKSEKDVKKIQHLVGVINGHFEGYRALDNDQLRAKTLEFKARIKSQTKELDSLIEAAQNEAEALSEGDLMGRDTIYQNIDKIKKDMFTALFQTLKNCTNIICLIFYEDHLYIQGMDKSHVCLFNIKIVEVSAYFFL